MNLPHQRIYLIGFMGSGKSYTGRRLAWRLEYAFYDLDTLIEQREQASISELFDWGGETHFRQAERSALEATRYLERSVIACGGGTPCFSDNMEWINQHGLSVFLNTDPALILHRLRTGRAHRPLIRELDDEALRRYVHNKRAARLPAYQKAMVEVCPDEQTVDTAALIHQHLPDIFGH